MRLITEDFGHGVDYACLIGMLHALAEKYPFITVSYMGTSLLGRGIPMITLGGERHRARSVLYVGAHHAAEHITSALLLRFVEDYCACLASHRRVYGVLVGRLYQSRRITVIPQLNVDGAELALNGAGEGQLAQRLRELNGGDDFRRWQANVRGVDLNHNYDEGFYEYKRLESSLGISGPCASRFAGEAPESEPECAALASLIRHSEELCGVLTLHTQGEEIYASSGGMLVRGMECAARLISSMTGYKISAPEGGACYGGLTDWCIRRLGLPSFTLECGLGENPLPMSELDAIYARLRELLFSFPLLA